MSWNYRIITQTYQTLDGETEESYAIHEVYYDEEENITAVSVNPRYPFGESLQELKEDMKRYEKAFDKPVLSMLELEEMWKKKNKEK